eukprot:SAG11_NODE_2408_length_3396_cov_2.260843_9_plen_24_part_01
MSLSVTHLVRLAFPSFRNALLKRH